MNTLESIKSRKTIKVIADEPLVSVNTSDDIISALMEAAYWAPFHKPCQKTHQKEHNESIMPWRFYILNGENCRKLAQYLKQENALVGKIEGMLNAADYLIQATWTPDLNSANSQNSEETGITFDGTIGNMEHIAAAGAAIQNLLLAATDLNLSNYWSSGGPLRKEVTFNKLGISKDEILLGSLFIFSNEEKSNINNKIERLPSKLRDKRGNIKKMYKILDI